MNKKINSGFTLVELLIVIGIIAILAAAIIIAISPGDQLQRARTSTVNAQMQSIATAAYNCLVEPGGTEDSCGGDDFGSENELSDIGMDAVVNHPVDSENCTYELMWSDGRVRVREACTAPAEPVTDYIQGESPGYRVF